MIISKTDSLAVVMLKGLVDFVGLRHIVRKMKMQTMTRIKGGWNDLEDALNVTRVIIWTEATVIWRDT